MALIQDKQGTMKSKWIVQAPRNLDRIAKIWLSSISVRWNEWRQILVINLPQINQTDITVTIIF